MSSPSRGKLSTSYDLVKSTPSQIPFLLVEYWRPVLSKLILNEQHLQD